jgi:GR25 family glycosyltransferase involved in LPS biosynthesis
MFYPLKIINQFENDIKNNILFILQDKENIEYKENFLNYSIIVSKNALISIHEKYYKTLIYVNEQLFFIYSKYNLSETIQSLQTLSKLKYKIISLQRTPKRRENLISQLKELEIEYDIFYAIDGKLININESGKEIIVEYKNEKYKHNPTIRKNKQLKMSYGEFGCALSHIKLYKEMKNNELYYIFEDDATIDNYNIFINNLRNIPSENSFDLIFNQNNLGYFPMQLKSILNKHYFYPKTNNVNLTHSYIITNKGAKNILNDIGDYVNVPSDDLLNNCIEKGILNYCVPFLRCISPNESKSTIWNIYKDNENYNDVKWDKEYIKNTILTMNNIADSRLGNQMFQYALLKLLSIRDNCNIVFDEKRTKHNNFSLHKFKNIDYNTSNNILISNRIKEKVEFELLDELKQPIKDNTNINGYFQNTEYFKKNFLEDNEVLVKELFDFDHQLQRNTNTYLNNIKLISKCKEVCAIHIRRGDLIASAEEPVYTLSTYEYIKNSILYIKDKIKTDVLFLIFSDSIDVVKNEFDGLQYIEDKIMYMNFNMDEMQSLVFMKNCDHFILSASTYCWWAAYLNNNKNKLVICPTPWFNQKLDRVKNNYVNGLMMDYMIYYNIHTNKIINKEECLNNKEEKVINNKNKEQSNENNINQLSTLNYIKSINELFEKHIN